MPRMVIILNPKAGAGHTVAEIEAWAGSHESTEVWQTKGPGDATRLAREAIRQGVRAVIAAGGDGTVNEVVNGLSADFSAAARGDSSKVALGIIPMGTGNDFSRAIAIPHETAAALSTLDRSHLRAIDVVHVTYPGGARFLLNAGTGGFSGIVHRNLEVRHKRVLGPLAYGFAAVKSLWNVRWHRVRITAGEEVFETKTYAIVVGNGQFVAGGYQFASAASIVDGKVDLTVVRAKTFWERLTLLTRYLFRLHLRSHFVIFRQAAYVKIESRPPMTFVVDGEPIAQTPIEFRVVPKALRLFVPEEVEETSVVAETGAVLSAGLATSREVV